VFLWLWLMKNSRGSTSATLESVAQQVELVGYVYPSQGKLVVSILARAVKPPGQGG
jgi:hypothetical protein